MIKGGKKNKVNILLSAMKQRTEQKPKAVFFIFIEKIMRGEWNGMGLIVKNSVDDVCCHARLF